MKARNKIANVLSAGIVLGFVIGLIRAIMAVVANRYVFHETYRLIFLCFKQNLNQSVFFLFFLVALLSLSTKLIWKFLISGVVAVYIKEKNKLIPGIIACIFSCLFFVCGGWVINHYVLVAYRPFHPVSLLVDFGVLSLSILLAILLRWVFFKVKLETLLNQLFEAKRMRKVAVLLIVFLLFLNLGVFVDSKVNAPKAPNVIWFLIDALRADHLGCYNYEKDTSPFIDRFASENILFKYAFSQESYTRASVPSYFTSTYPLVHQVFYREPTNEDVLDSRFMTFAEVLRNENYNTVAFLYNPVLRAASNLGQGFDLYDRGKRSSDHSLPYYEIYETAEKIHEKVERYLKKSKKRPVFLYLHYLDVHYPYAPPPPYHQLFLPSDIEPAVALMMWDRVPRTKENADLYISQYDGEIRYTDDYIEKTLHLLEDYNINSKNSIVIITADHGEEFFDYHPQDLGDCGHGRTLYMEQIHVPLILSIPHVEPTRKIINSYVELVDIVPTVLDVLGIDYKKYTQFQGRSLIPVIENDNTGDSHLAYSGGNYGRGIVIEDGYAYYEYDKYAKEKNLRAYRPRDDYYYIFKEELYDIKADPKETENVIHEKRNIALELKEKLLNLKEKFSDQKPAKSIKADDQTLEELKSLGYL